MKGFKLLAIVPLKGCDLKFRKSLDVGKVFQFYNNYQIELNEESSEIISVIPNESNVPNELYALKNGIHLNFSAVVGKNGSGKSTLFELFYYLVYLLGIEKKLGDKRILKPYSSELKWKTKNLVDTYGDIIESIKSYEKNLKNKNNLSISAFIYSTIKRHDLDLNTNMLQSDINFFNAVKNEVKAKEDLNHVIITKEEEVEDEIKNGINVSVIYCIDDTIYELSHFGKQLKHYKYESSNSKVDSNIDALNLEQFFYSISLNFSHHSLNSETIGNWVTRLFHKNDAYTTPLVINPMRDNGNFNINRELALSKERLMANLIFDLVKNKEKKFLEKYSISTFIFTPKSSTRPILNQLPALQDMKPAVILENKLGLKEHDLSIKYYEEAICYLEAKINRIINNYGDLIDLFTEGKDIQPLNKVDYFLLNDKSHVTKKIRQVVNYLRIASIKENKEFWKLTRVDNSANDKSVDDILKWLDLSVADKESMPPFDLIEYVLPAFFNIDFFLVEESKKEEPFMFGKLSSGEQQMILNINAITYHLYNLQSVHGNSTSNGSNRVAYENVQVILDEVELYYHPEMQRMLLKELHHAFEHVKKKGEGGIQSINVCFLTHSPFILSDIPSENVLRLDNGGDVGDSKIEETFAANIQDILGNGFFMKILIGEFAFEKLMKAFVALKENKNADTVSDAEKMLKYIGDPLIRKQLKRMIHD